jgi:hypothetical protein
VSQPDTVIFEFAREESRAIVTENIGDFRRIVTECIDSGKSHHGIIFNRRQRFLREDPRTIGRLVTLLADLMASNRDITNLETWLTDSP